MYPGVVCVLPLLIALRPKLRELQCVLIAATSPLLYVRVHLMCATNLVSSFLRLPL